MKRREFVGLTGMGLAGLMFPVTGHAVPVECVTRISIINW